MFKSKIPTIQTPKALTIRRIGFTIREKRFCILQSEDSTKAECLLNFI